MFFKFINVAELNLDSTFQSNKNKINCNYRDVYLYVFIHHRCTRFTNLEDILREVLKLFQLIFHDNRFSEAVFEL